MAEPSYRTFPYKGRIIYTFPASSGATVVTYQASPEVVSQIKTKYGQDFVYANKYVYLGEYPKNSSAIETVTTSPAYDKNILGGISNYDLVTAMDNDKNFYKQATGNQSNNTTPVDPNQPGTPGTSIPTNPPNQSGFKRQVQSLRYPSDMSTLQDTIKFQALNYSSDIGSRLPNVGSYVIGKPKYTIEGPPVYLAIQSPISDQNSVGWESDTINPIELTAGRLSYSAMTTPGIEDLTKQTSDTFLNALKELKKESQAVRTWLVGQAIGVNNLVSRLQGQVLNPNLELLFQGPQLRPFNFTFKMSPRNAGEAKEVKDIINYFKKNMAPIVNDSGIFLEAPNVFKIEYLHKNAEHKGLNLIKKCALTNCSVDYTPLGSYMTYTDGTMVCYTLNLQFQELEPVYSKDYKDHPIGH